MQSSRYARRYNCGIVRAVCYKNLLLRTRAVVCVCEIVQGIAGSDFSAASTTTSRR